MPNVVTFRCDDELLEEIDDATDNSPHETRAQFLRSHLEQTLGETESNHIESLAERVTETEREIEQLKRRLEESDRDRIESNQSESDSIESNRFDSNTRDSAHESEQQLEFSHDSARSGAEIGSALEGFRPGRNAAEREERRESAHAALEWLRDQPAGVTAGDVKHALYDTHGVDGQTEQTWWTETAREAFRTAESNGYVEIDGRKYEWTGE